MLTEMNNAGLSSICHGTNGLNGSALRAILSTFGPVVAAVAPACVAEGWLVVVVGAHAASTIVPMTTAMTGHRRFRAIMFFLPAKGYPSDRAPQRSRAALSLRPQPMDNEDKSGDLSVVTF